jgi:hypothetical protein
MEGKVLGDCALAGRHHPVVPALSLALPRLFLGKF